MTANDAINKIRVMLGVAQDGETTETQQVELAKATLVDGTEVYCENDFAEGEQLYVVTEEGDVPAPEGSHETEDGRIISVDAGGKITKVEEKVEEEAETEEEEVEMSTDISLSEEVVSNVMDALSKISESITALETRLNTTEQEFQEFRNEPAGKKITNNLNEVQQLQGDIANGRFNKILEYRQKSLNK